MEIRSYYEQRAMPKVIGESDSRTIEGYAIVFEKESRMMFDWWKDSAFIEVIKRGAITEEDIKKYDVKCLLEHDKSRLLARSFNGVGSLTLSVDDYGVKYRFDAPNTADGDTALELVRRGDLFGSSFAFTADEEVDVKYTRKADGTLLRTVNKLSGMYDVSIVTDPAYFGTDVTLRNLGDLVEQPKKEVDNQGEIKMLRDLSK